MISSLPRHVFFDFRDDLEDGHLDRAIKRLPNQQITDEISNDPELKEAAIEGIKFHLIVLSDIGYPEESDIDTAVRLKEIFHISSEEIDGIVKEGVEKLIMKKGGEYGEQILKSFGISKEFMESEAILSAKEVFLHGYGRREGSIN